MNTSKLKTFAQEARRTLMEQVAARIEVVLRMEGAALAENETAVRDLKQAILKTSKAKVTERVAYIWFNRFCALRFMDMNNYTLIRVVSPTDGATQPEILAEAKQGIIHDDLAQFIDRNRVNDLLTGNIRSQDAQGEVYRSLLVGVCNYYHRMMPYLFEKIDDYSELLMPVDLLSDDSILSAMQMAMDAEACTEVEVIGWLYQFYISEKKDAVFASKDKVSADDIPAATQLFTPNWIVRYLVENSLGRLWMLNHPDSRLVDKMDYYIQPEQQEEDYLKINSPEALRVCDPACGSGHMLVYAFDLLYAIYEEAGYVPSDIPALILTHNLYGIEIDERAGVLAAFALTMKAREQYRRFFRNPVQPNICVMENISFSPDEIKNYMAHVGKDLFTQDFWVTVRQFTEAKQFGSLIRPQMKNAGDLYARLEETGAFEDIFLHSTNTRMQKLLEMARYLSAKYHVVVANPPYMGGRNMNDEIKDFAKDEYKDSKSDLFAMFIERGFELACTNGYNAMVTMQSWMFLSSYEALREKLLKTATIECMVHMANMVMGIAFGTNATVWQKQYKPDYKGQFSYVEYEDLTDDGIPREFPVRNERLKTASATDFKKIPGSPIAYWVSDRVREIFAEGTPLGEVAEPRQGMATADNDRFLRFWHEVSQSRVGYNMQDRKKAQSSGMKWFPYNKGGQYRKWYGNQDYLVNWENDGTELFDLRPKSVVRSPDTYFRKSLSWSKVTAGAFSLRAFPEGFLYDVAGCSIFTESEKLYECILGVMNSPVMTSTVSAIAPTMNYEVGQIKSFPVIKDIESVETQQIRKSIQTSIKDWDSYELSWDFADLPLLYDEHRANLLVETYANLRQHWQAMTLEMQELEEENNRIFIEAYGLQDELTPDVPLSEITLTCNPHYRYDSKSSDEKLEARLLADTMREFISYAVGCMFGRYALEKGGLILANQGETLEDYTRRVPNPSFPADADNVIPILDDNWFTDDIVERFSRFLKLTFGDEHYETNLRFIESALGKDVRSYFVKDFYDDHIKRYSKRPIYWLFSSPNGSFNALIYMHRYRPDTVNVVRNEYLREYSGKLQTRITFLETQSISTSVSAADRTAALKEMDRLNKIVRELEAYDRDTLYPLATKNVKIDLDDGVAVNYLKFGAALKKVTGLSK